MASSVGSALSTFRPLGSASIEVGSGSSLTPCFQKISLSTQVSPFSGRVVAYKTNSTYFRSGYRVDDTYFGYIDPSLTIWSACSGYRMTRVTKPKDFANHCVLIEGHLKGADFSMRLATAEEVALLNRAITDDQAKFEYMVGKERMKEILESHLSELDSNL